ncbi:MAG: DUF2271 domain-containing protein [Clostridia bacterium]|nr:DUF2271 domain-containing protein [Clostridia bacterium]
MKKAMLLLVLFLCLVFSGCTTEVTDPPADTDIPTTDNSQAELDAEAPMIPENTESSLTSESQLVVMLNFTRAGTMASNQYAVWIEDADGALVKTLYVSSFTADGGYARRAESLPTWVSKANPAEMEAAAVDAVTSATPQSGLQSHSWDGTNENGDAMPSGEYHVFVEGTLYWTSSVLYSGSFEWGGDTATVEMTPVYTEEDNETNKDMITQVSAEYLA